MATPTHVLTGHSEAVLELQWLNKERLATWSKDRTLRLWSISDQLKSRLGGEVVASEGEMGVESTPHRLPTSPSLTIATTITTSITPTSTPSNNALASAGVDPSSLEESGGERGMMPHSILDGTADLTMSLPITKSFGVVDGGISASGGFGMLSGSPSTLSLRSEFSTSSLSSINPVFQSLGGHSLAKEFSHLRVETIPNLEIETVRVGEGGVCV